jgi:hypothetical protein
MSSAVNETLITTQQEAGGVVGGATCVPSTGPMASEGARLQRMFVVLCAVTAAIHAPAKVKDVATALTGHDRRALQVANAPLLVSVTDGLDALVDRGSARRSGEGYLPIVQAAGAGEALGGWTSRRRRVLALVGRTVIALGRAALVRDVVEYAERHAPESLTHGLTSQLIARDLLGFLNTGEVIVVGTVRGNKSDGSNLYLPATLADERAAFVPDKPLTWLDYVVTTIGGLWAERVRHAAKVGDKPRPLTTAELRNALRGEIGDDGLPVATSAWGQDLEHPMTVTLALQILSKSDTPAVMPLRGRMAVWIPAGVDLDTVGIEDGYSSDSDRIVEAARRATSRLGQPAVTPGDVREEISFDESLTLAGPTSVARVLSDLAKSTVATGSSERRSRRTRRIIRVGKVHGAAAYCVLDTAHASSGASSNGRLSQAQRYVEQGLHVRLIDEAECSERVSRLETVKSRAIVVGRARLLVAEIHELLPVAKTLAEQGVEEAQPMVAQLERAREIAIARSESSGKYGVYPDGIERTRAGVTAMGLRDLLSPLSPTAARFEGMAQVVRQYSRLVKRFPNPSYTDRRSGDPNTSPQFLFDRVEALWYASRQWGGAQARVAALIAEQELGELRDPRFVFIALDSPDVEQRLRAVASLAFLQPREAVALLTARATADDSAGVREAALWALGFIHAPEVDQVLDEAARMDASDLVRRSAKRFRSLGPNWWWAA